MTALYNTRIAGANSISLPGIASPDCCPDCGGGGGGGLIGGLIGGDDGDDGDDGDGGTTPNTLIAHFSIILSSITSGILQHFDESCVWKWQGNLVVNCCDRICR